MDDTGIVDGGKVARHAIQQRLVGRLDDLYTIDVDSDDREVVIDDDMCELSLNDRDWYVDDTRREEALLRGILQGATRKTRQGDAMAQRRAGPVEQNGRRGIHETNPNTKREEEQRTTDKMRSACDEVALYVCVSIWVSPDAIAKALFESFSFSIIISGMIVPFSKFLASLRSKTSVGFVIELVDSSDSV